METQYAPTTYRNGRPPSAPSAKTLEDVLILGDLSGLTPELKTAYYNEVCKSLGLNPLTQPFAFIKLNGKEVLYAKRDCTEQLRKIHNISIQIVAREKLDDLYIVTARATRPDGRTDESVGAVPLKGLSGENLANAIMKGETKSKRRVTLSICGLGLLDETEVDSIPNARVVSTEPNPALEKLNAAVAGTGVDPDHAPQIPAPAMPEVPPLDNPWMFKLTRNGVTKHYAEVDPKWFSNIDARYGHGSMTAEEYVNAKSCKEHEERDYLKQVALEAIAMLRESEMEKAGADVKAKLKAQAEALKAGAE